jgi:hypothetical protein
MINRKQSVAPAEDVPAATSALYEDTANGDGPEHRTTLAFELLPFGSCNL